MPGALTITSDRLDEIIRAEAARLLADRIAAMDPAQLNPQLDFRPASWFAEAWGLDVKTFLRLARKAGLSESKLTQKTRLYSVTEANEKIRARGLQPPRCPRARTTVA